MQRLFALVRSLFSRPNPAPEENTTDLEAALHEIVEIYRGPHNAAALPSLDSKISIQLSGTEEPAP